MSAKVSLDDKYTLDHGRVFISGTQALVRLPLMQLERDRAAGIDTACYITGYRGSPLAGLDQQLSAAKKFFATKPIVFQPAVNEDTRRDRGLGKPAGWDYMGPPNTQAYLPCGTERDRGWIVPATLCAMAILPARPRSAASCCSLATITPASHRQPVIERVCLRRCHDSGAEPGRRTGNHRFWNLRLGTLTLQRLLGSAEMRERHGRSHGIG